MNSATYYHNLCDSYRINLRRIAHSPDTQCIHELRIIIKKMRAVFHLVTFTNSEFDFDEHFDSFMEMFKSAGKIRDLDIAIECSSKIAKDHPDTDYRGIAQVLRKERRSNVPKVKKIANQILAQKKYDSKAEEIISMGIEEKRIENFLKQTMKKIGSETHERLSTERLHNIRKLYKEILYVSKATGKTDKQFFAKNSIQADELQKRIGNWHNLVITTSIIKDHTKKAKGMKSLLKALKNEEKKLKKKAVREISLTSK